MSRVATYGNYQSALMDLMASQTRMAEAQTRIATQKNATDLVGYGRQSETLTAMKGSMARLQGFIDTGEAVSARLTTQDLAMNRVNDAITDLRSVIGNALATESNITLMQESENAFQSIRGGLNSKHNGAYLFGGAHSDQQPMTAASLVDLAAAPATASVFTNDDLKSASRIGEGTMIETGVLAPDLGQDVLDILRDIQVFNDGPQGPLSGKMTTTQRDFLTTQLSRLEAASAGVVNRIALTGTQAQQVETVMDDNRQQLSALEGLMSNKTDADMAKAITDLQLSQVAVQASAQVISQLRDVSLLNFLR
ncbi:MAG: hypothetical protein HZY74_06080 [Brevundimonas sp.]|nr:MAG: hypothetical protein HZY74_06080 [Brevundimonas sp.]